VELPENQAVGFFRQLLGVPDSRDFDLVYASYVAGLRSYQLSGLFRGGLVAHFHESSLRGQGTSSPPQMQDFLDRSRSAPRLGGKVFDWRQSVALAHLPYRAAARIPGA
jgi:hypothetical protein